MEFSDIAKIFSAGNWGRGKGEDGGFKLGTLAAAAERGGKEHFIAPFGTASGSETNPDVISATELPQTALENPSQWRQRALEWLHVSSRV